MAVHPRVRSEHDTLQSPVGSPLHEWAWVAMDYQTILTFPEHRRILCARLSSGSGSCDTSRCRGRKARLRRATGANADELLPEALSKSQSLAQRIGDGS